MKKSIYAIMAAVTLFTGCAQEQNVETSVPHGKRLVTIQADIIPTKTTVTDEGIYSWSANETIGVVEQDGEAVIPFTVKDAENGLFSGTLTSGNEPVFAVSPTAFFSGVAELGGDIEYDITLDNIDNYVPGTTNAIMVAEYSGKDGDEYKFHFTHAAALVKVRVENVPVGTAKVKLTLDKNITGIWEDLTSTNPVLGEDTELGEPSLTLTLKKAVTNPNTSADYYFPVPCNTYTSFQFELLNADGDRIKGMKKTGLNIPLDAADLFLAPTITLEPVEIVKGAEWTYTFTAKKFDKNGTQTLTDAEDVEMDWTLDGTYSDTGSWGYDSTKGQQFGSANKPYSALTLTADSGVDGIEDVVINTSGASSIKATVSVSVAGTPFIIKGSDPAEDSADLTATATEYTFTSPDGKLYAGDIVISYENSSSKAIYLKSISLNPDTRIDPELSYSTDAYNVVASSAFETPVLSAVEGFDGTVTYAIGGEDDPDVASVNAETGAVTIGAKDGTVTVTASFAGNANYKPDSASYTITVGAAALLVTEPAAAECSANSTTTFTVTSNVEWSATTDDGEIITNIDPSTAQSPSADPVTVTVTLAANTGAQRTATVKVRPTNQTAYSELNQDVTVTQKVYTADVIYEKYSGVLTAGTYLLVDATDGVAMRSKISSDRAEGRDIAEYETGKIKNPIASIVWEIAASGDYWTVYSDTTSTYIAGTGAKNKAQLVDEVSDYSKWSVSSNSQSSTYDFVNKQNTANSVNATLRYNNGYGFACYASGTGHALTLYKLVDNTVWDLQSIAVKTEPKVTYEVGEHFDPAGLVITATYSDHDGVKDNKTVDIAYNNTTAEQFTFSPTTSTALTSSNDEVSITWGGKSTTQAITVSAPIEWSLKSIDVKTAPTKVTYTVGEYFAPAGLVLTATYEAAGQTDKTEDVAYTNANADDFTFEPDTTTPLTLNDGAVSITWGGKTTSQVITVNEPSYDFTTVAELNALATSTNTTNKSGYLTDAVVSYVPDTGNAIIKDATGSVLLYKSGHGLLQGQTFTGELDVTIKLYNNCAELTACNASFVGEGETVDPATVTLAQLAGNLSTYQNAYVKAENLVVKAVSGKNITVTDDGGTTSYNVYSSPANASCSVGDVLSVIGTVASYSNNDQIKVWNTSNISVTGKAVIFSQPASGGAFTVSVGGNQISNYTPVSSGTTVTLSATVEEGYTFSDWTVTGATVADASAAETTFTMGTSAVTVSASFTSTGGGGQQPTSYSVTYTQSYSGTGHTVTTTGTAPANSSCSWTTTYTNSNQLTKDNSMTYTLSGFGGKKITGLSLHLKTNASKGTGSVSMKHGSTEFGSYSIPVIGSTYELKSATVTSTTIGTTESVTVTITADANSVYCDYITVTYE